MKPSAFKKCTLWTAIFRHGIIGQFFFEDDRVNTLTVTKERTVPELEQFWGELEKCEDLDEKEQWLQQDDAPPYTGNSARPSYVKSFGSVSSAAKPKWNGHLTGLT